jgi:hypothetical protein
LMRKKKWDKLIYQLEETHKKQSVKGSRDPIFTQGGHLFKAVNITHFVQLKAAKRGYIKCFKRSPAHCLYLI